MPMRAETFPPETAGGHPGPGRPDLRGMFSALAGRYDLANRILSLGRDPFWRLALARRLKLIDAPGRLLDLAAGTGDQLAAAKKLLPGLMSVGLDLAPAMLDLARAKLERLPPPTPELVVGDALEPPFADETFDSVSISFGLRNIVRRKELYRRVWRLLKPGGRFLILEMFHRPRRPWSGAVKFYLRHGVPFLGGRLLTRELGAYRYLASSVLAFPPPETIAGELSAAGFTNLSLRVYTFDTVMLVWGERPTRP